MRNPALFWTETILLGIYLLLLVVLFVYSVGQLLLRRGADKINKPVPRPTANGTLPGVTVQLPVYNEQYVIERLLLTVAKLDYPREKLQVQLLDDSTDETTFIASQLIPGLRAAGLDIVHIRRDNRDGFKAGALAEGLRSAKGDLIVIFDADFIPSPDFLLRTVPYFQDEKIGAVQTRWGYVNEQASLLTEIESFLLSLHFSFEQPNRYRAGLFLNFNGTCGAWRKTAIESSGGWNARTITEDIDLSYRAQLAGWKLIYLNDYVCKGELPEDMSGLRTQQFRWMKGGAENARIHIPNIVRSDLPAVTRRHAYHHLLGGSVYLVILVALLLSVPLAFLKNTGIRYDYKDFGLPFVTSTIALFSVFYYAQSTKWNGRKNLRWFARFLFHMILFLVFTMGMATHNGIAVLSGWLGIKSPFVRTPKYGGNRWSATRYARMRFNFAVLYDIAFIGLLLTGLIVGYLREQYAFMPMQLMALAGALWVTGLSVLHPIRAALFRPTGPVAMQLTSQKQEV